MRKRRRYNLPLAVVLLLMPGTAKAQDNYLYKAALPLVDSGGFYKIILSPQVTAKSQQDLADIRIMDGKSNAVPYIIKTDLPVFNKNSFIDFPIISSRREADKQTHVVVSNASSRAISDLLLVVKSNEARRSVTLSGSDDNKRWYVIKENIQLENYFSAQGNFVQTLSFPSTAYKYFQVIILGENILPVNIVKAGIYTSNYSYGKYVELPKPLVKQNDSSNKTSYILLTFDNTYQADKLELQLAGPKFFRRNIKVYPADEDFNNPVWFTINSSSSPSFPVQFHTNKLIAEIDNEDNPSLQIKGATAWQLNRYLLAYLENGKEYNLYFGKKNASAPKYDLEFFKDSIGKNPVEIHVNKIEAIVNSAAKAEKPGSIFKTVSLWVVIGLVLALLLFLTFKMSKEVNQRSQE